MKEKYTCLILLLLFAIANGKAQHASKDIREVAPGVYKITFGVPDQFTPYAFCSEAPLIESLKALPEFKAPFELESIEISINSRGCVVNIPLTENEQLYGFGLQMNSFNQKGLKRMPIVNDNPLNDLGLTHAPVPMYVSTNGYAILVNTSRYTTFYCGTLKGNITNQATTEKNNKKPETSIEGLYGNIEKATNAVVVDVPNTKGLEVFVFLGPDMKNVVQRYNLFSGGGAMPALWGLGVKYRVKGDSRQEDVYRTSRYFRDNDIPCDVLGLEPQWQTTAYSCSYIWNNQTFPEPQKLIDSMKTMNFRLNLWEHAFVNPASPIYSDLKEKSGDYLVWNGLVPDFVDPHVKEIFSNYHENNFVKQGISGFKLDECDNSDLTRGGSVWSFPEMSQFPSGIDGEQMHQIYGVLYARTMNEIYKRNNQRTYLDYRASSAFASSIPASLYSDTYDHTEYIRMISNSGFTGLLWSPELRESNSETELIRRIQTTVLSAQTLINSWYLQHPPWLQYDKEKNNASIFLENSKELEALVKIQLNFRMSLIPYLYTAFAKYHYEGIPPFRALVLDYPHDVNVQNIFDEYMIGDGILAAPLTGESDTREVYLPEGGWYNFNTNEKYEGGKTYTVRISLSQVPIFVKEGTLLPLAKPVESVIAGQPFDITCKVYGNLPADASLFEDDGTTYNFEKGNFNWLKLKWNDKKGKVERIGDFKGRLYKIESWELVR
jgi:alpha-D-xyloside xylohydrolase